MLEQYETKIVSANTIKLVIIIVVRLSFWSRDSTGIKKKDYLSNIIQQNQSKMLFIYDVTIFPKTWIVAIPFQQISVSSLLNSVSPTTQSSR